MQKRFNHYYLTEQIGSKPLRSTYLAHHVNDASQKVLLKIFDATCLALGQESERLIHQVEWIKQLRHAHMVPILDLGVERGQPYIVSEYLSGGSLRYRLDSLSPGRLSLDEALKIILQVGQALSYFHGSAHLHQNIKPENIFFNEREEALLADFCLSGFIDVAILDYQSDPRNMCYMAPEQFMGSASEKSDQYALACLAYELIAGQMPFFAESFAMMWASHYAQFPTPLSDRVPGLPKRIEKAIVKAMAKDPSERHTDIAAFLLALEGTSPSSVPAIAKPLALSTLDPFVAGAVEPLEDIKSSPSVTTSLTGIPSEGSLATAPFGTSLAGRAFGVSLPGAPFGVSLPGAPFGTSLPGNPFTASLSGMALATNQEDEIQEKREEDQLGANLAENILETNWGDEIQEKREEDQLGANLAENILEMNWEDEIQGKEEEGQLEASLARNMFDDDLEDEIQEKREEDQLETILAGNMFDEGQGDEIQQKTLREASFEMSLAGDVFATDLGESLFAINKEDELFEDALGENPFEIGLIETPLTTQLLERWERASSEPYPKPNPDTPTGRSRSISFSKRSLWRTTKYSIPALWAGRPRKPSVAVVWLTQLGSYLGRALNTLRASSKRVLVLLSKLPVHLFELWQRVSSKLNAKKAVVADGSDGDAPVKPFSVRRVFQSRRDPISVILFGQRRQLPTPALWLVLVLSIIILIIGITSDIFLTMQSSQLHSVNLNKKNHATVPIDTQLIAQPVAHSTGLPIPQQSSPSALSELSSQTSLVGSYAGQFQTDNLSNEGRLDWIDWGLHMPGDVNHKSGVQQQISTFTVISNGFNPGIVQRASYNANARLWWSDGTPVMVEQPQQASGVYVMGANKGFSFSVPASAISRTLRVYVAVNGARGKFTASLNGRTYVDKSLSSAYDPSGPQVNGIYTLVFNSVMPNQFLTVTYTAITTDGINGYVLLRAASLR